MKLQTQLIVLGLWFKDVFYKHGLWLAGSLFYLAYKLSFCFYKKNAAYSYLLKAHRAFVTGRYSLSGRPLENELINQLDDICDGVNVDKQQGIDPLSWILIRSLILKPVKILDDKIVEKGVLLVKFTTTFSLYLEQINCQLLLKHYRLVLEPSSSGYALPEILKWTQFDEPIIVEASEKRDREFLKNLDSNLIPVDFGSSDWVDYRIFKPLNLSKEYDVIYVANYNWVKRPHVYFKAINEIIARGVAYRPLLVCGLWGENKSEILQLIKHYKIEDVLVVVEEASPAYLNELFNKSKVNILLTLKEGSNRTIFEGFFAGTPGIVLKENVGVNKNYINEQTGSLIRETELVDTLLYYKDHWQNHRPHQWAMSSISPDITTKKLNNLLYDLAVRNGEEWTQDIAVKVNSPEAVLMYPDSGPYEKNVMQVEQLRNFTL